MSGGPLCPTALDPQIPFDLLYIHIGSRLDPWCAHTAHTRMHTGTSSVSVWFGLLFIPTWLDLLLHGTRRKACRTVLVAGKLSCLPRRGVTSIPLWPGRCGTLTDDTSRRAVQSSMRASERVEGGDGRGAGAVARRCGSCSCHAAWASLGLGLEPAGGAAQQQQPGHGAGTGRVEQHSTAQQHSK